jgi:hypothetical protein
MKGIKIRTIIVFLIAMIMATSLLYSPLAWNLRVIIAERVLVTRFQPYAWIFVGKAYRDKMLQDRLIKFCGHLPDKNHPCD